MKIQPTGTCFHSSWEACWDLGSITGAVARKQTHKQKPSGAGHEQKPGLGRNPWAAQASRPPGPEHDAPPFPRGPAGEAPGPAQLRSPNTSLSFCIRNLPFTHSIPVCRRNLLTLTPTLGTLLKFTDHLGRHSKDFFHTFTRHPL